MTFTEFLAAMVDALDESCDLPSAPVSLSPEPIPRVIYNPTCQVAAATDQILIGLGQWCLGEHPVEHRGVCLNNKGTAERFGAAYRYATVTGLVLNPPESLPQHWESLTGGLQGPVEILRHFTLIVEDSGPDSCLALLCWLARSSGVDLGELRAGALKAWVQAVRDWETTGMAEDPSTSWAALLSTLGHSYLPTGGTTPEIEARHPRDFSHGWREALRFTLALLRQEANPNALHPAWGVSGYVRARAFLEVERQEYLQALDQAMCLQLWVPLTATDGARRLLVDAYFAVETWPSGSRKLFIRNDRDHSYLHQGFALMGLHRPGERGTGGDMTLSVNPWTGIDLQALWLELERLESERWQGERPRDHIRPIASYPNGEGYNEPWWDDSGRYSLLGAPKALPGCPAGSRLDWMDVLEAAWRCYSPVHGLQVRDLLDQRDCPLAECRRIALKPDHGSLSKHLAAVRWLPDSTRPQALFLAPTTLRALAALVVRGKTECPLTLADLPAQSDLTLVLLTSGFSVLHESGVILFDDWRNESLPLDELQEEVRRCVQLLGVLREAESHLAADRQADSILDATRKPWKSIGILADLSAQRANLARAQNENAPASLSSDVRRFRAQLTACWGIDQAAEELQSRLTQLEDAIRTASALRTQGLVQILSVYGLPFFISGGIVTQLGSWLKACSDAMHWDALGSSLLNLGVYLGIATSLILGVRMLQRHWTRSQDSTPPSH